MQLTRAARVVALSVVLAAPALGLLEGVAWAQVVDVDTTQTLYHEAPSRGTMTVFTPGVTVAGTPAEWLTVRGGWEADVVSGASVAVKAGPAYRAASGGADVITTASVSDMRNVARGGFSLRKDSVEVTGGYSYSTEKDYRSHAFVVSAKTDAYEHNTQFALSYARNIDRVCDRVQGAGEQPARFRALEDSKGCFASSDDLRTTRPVDVDGYEGSWAQAWTPVFTTQAVYTVQVLNGFQSNPYRSVIVGQGVKAQEHVPENRARQALSLRANLYLRPLKAALRLGGRAYWDTWDIGSGAVDAELEKYFGEALRATIRGRFYRQSGALFWSDDYTGGDRPLGPKGQYFTGDRELSPFATYTGGLRATYAVTPKAGRILGMMLKAKLSASYDLVHFDYDEFTFGGDPVGNANAHIFIFGASGSF